MRMNFEIKDLPEYHIAYMRRVGKYGVENYDIMDKLKKWAKNKGLFTYDNIIFGIAQDNPQFISDDCCRYDVGITLQKRELLDDAVEFTILPKGQYLVFTIRHIASEIEYFWCQLDNIIKDLQVTIDENRVIIEQFPIALVENGYCLMCVPLK